VAERTPTPANAETRPASGTRLYYLGDTGVLFCERLQELHLLNATGTVIWSLLEEGADEASIAEQLHRAFGLDEARSRQFTRDALSEWRKKGLLADGDASAPEPVTSPQDIGVLGPAWHASESRVERHYGMLSSRIAIGFSSKAQLHVVHPVLEHLAIESDDDLLASTCIDILESADGFLLYRDGQLLARCDAIDALAPAVKSAIWTTVLRDHRYFLDIHAGVVSDGKACLLLPAPPGSGKSTLTAALVHAGYEFFSDEIALLEDATLDVFPVPLALCIKDGGIAALADRYPVLRSLPIHRRGDGKRVAYMTPPADRRASDERARRVVLLVFPRFVSGAATDLRLIPAAEALQCLTGQCMAVRERLNVHRVERLVRWIAAMPCHALTYGSTDGAVEAVAALFPPAGAGSR
jgi:hypothetical protein